MANSRKNDYKVGFQKPPENGRFQPGRSGNPKGRPKGTKNTATMFREICLEQVRVKTDNGYRTISKLEAIFVQMVNKAASGDLRATREFARWAGSYPLDEKAKLPSRNIVIEFVEAINGKPAPVDPNRKEEIISQSEWQRRRKIEDDRAREVKDPTSDEDD